MENIGFTAVNGQDEPSIVCTSPSIAQDYLTCKGEMTFAEAYDACGDLLDGAYIHGCCEMFADDCLRHERLFQQDLEWSAEQRCDICLAIYSWEEDAASGSCSQECRWNQAASEWYEEQNEEEETGDMSSVFNIEFCNPLKYVGPYDERCSVLEYDSSMDDVPF